MDNSGHSSLLEAETGKVHLEKIYSTTELIDSCFKGSSKVTAFEVEILPAFSAQADRNDSVLDWCSAVSYSFWSSVNSRTGEGKSNDRTDRG